MRRHEGREGRGGKKGRLLVSFLSLSPDCTEEQNQVSRYKHPFLYSCSGSGP